MNNGRETRLLSGFESLAECNGSRGNLLYPDQKFSPRRNVWSHIANSARGNFYRGEHRRRLWTRTHSVVRAIPQNVSRLIEGTGNAFDFGKACPNCSVGKNRSFVGTLPGAWKDASRIHSQPTSATPRSMIARHSLFPTHYSPDIHSSEESP